MNWFQWRNWIESANTSDRPYRGIQLQRKTEVRLNEREKNRQQERKNGYRWRGGAYECDKKKKCVLIIAKLDSSDRLMIIQMKHPFKVIGQEGFKIWFTKYERNFCEHRIYCKLNEGVTVYYTASL